MAGVGIQASGLRADEAIEIQIPKFFIPSAGRHIIDTFISLQKRSVTVMSKWISSIFNSDTLYIVRRILCALIGPVLLHIPK